MGGAGEVYEAPAEAVTRAEPLVGGVVVRDLARSFGRVHAVRGMDLEAPAGRVTALVGPNGSGKTTLLLMIAGLLVPDSGSIRVAGFDPVTQAAAVHARLGWMPDAFGAWDALSAREHLETYAAAYRVPRHLIAPRAADLLHLVDLTDWADAPARVLSRGQKQRLGLARAMVHDPAVLLLDEPASGLDPGSRVALRLLLRRMAADGKAVLVSSHVLSDLDEMADDAVYVLGGRTVRPGDDGARLALIAGRGAQPSTGSGDAGLISSRQTIERTSSMPSTCMSRSVRKVASPFRSGATTLSR